MTTTLATHERVAPFYRQLPRGPSRLSREEIARHQRVRLQGALIEAVARHGYSATTVADLVAYAGVSRRSLYEHYQDKHECLQATHDSLIRQASRVAVRAWSAHRGWSNQLHGACRALFEQAAAYPHCARLVLVDSPAIWPGGLVRAQAANLAFERILRASVQPGRSDRDLPRLSARAIVGGIRQVLYTRVQVGGFSELSALADDVIDWVELYRAPASRAWSSRMGMEPAVARSVSDLVVSTDPCEARILHAMADLIAEIGYWRITDSQLARRSRIPTQALHRRFPNKHACGRALLESIGATALGEARVATEGLKWPRRVGVGLGAYLAWLGAHPKLAKLLFLGAFEVGDEERTGVFRPVSELVDLLLIGAPQPRRSRRIVREATTGAIAFTILAQIAAGRVTQLHALTERLTLLVLTPYATPAAGLTSTRLAYGAQRP